MKTNNIKERIREYFFVNPTTKLRVRQIERNVKVPLPSVIRYTKELEKEKILKTTKIANIVTYSAQRTSKELLMEKKLYNIKSLFSLTNFLIEELSNPVIIVFGSYSKGEDIEKSDIDIYIETPEKKETVVKKFEKSLNRSIQIFMYKSIDKIENKDLANNIINGIVLNGYLEVLK
ncbi:MAG: nucleotidyltransferase domain-containing protein [archaeon]